MLPVHPTRKAAAASDGSSASDVDSEGSREDDDGSGSSSGSPSRSAARRSTWDQRVRVARALARQREELVRVLHTVKSRHVVDNFFSLVTGNMAVVCWILGAVYRSRACNKPLAGFLVLLGGLAIVAACLPVLTRQWFYLHARFNWCSAGLLLGSALYVVWLLVGQSWAFECSAATCDEELCAATNVSVFILYAALLIYAAKVAWYLAFRVRFHYRALLSSCCRDPYPDALRVDEDEFARLRDMVAAADASEVRVEVAGEE